MKFKKHEIFFTPIVFILILLLSLCSFIPFHLILDSQNGFIIILNLLLLYCIFVFWTFIFLKIIRSLYPLEEEVLSMEDDNKKIRAWKLQGFLYIFNLGLLFNSSLLPINLRSYFYSFLGARIGKCVMIGGKILEPPLVTIGDYCHLGEDSIISGHGIAGPLVTLRKVSIGNNVTIGAGAIISPGAIIKDGSVVAMGSVVTGKSVIPPNEIWGGTPAIKIGIVKKTPKPVREAKWKPFRL